MLYTLARTVRKKSVDSFDNKEVIPGFMLEEDIIAAADVDDDDNGKIGPFKKNYDIACIINPS